jgi:hypothetical protein
MKKLLLNLIVLFCTPVFMSAVELAWDANPDPSVAGYHVYFAKYFSDRDIAFTGEDYDGRGQTLFVLPAAHIDTEPNTDYVFSVTAVNAAGVESNFSNKTFVLPRSVTLMETFELTQPADWHPLQTEFYDAAKWPFVRQHLVKRADGAVVVSVELSDDLVSWVTLFSVPRSGEVIPVAFYSMVFS